MSAPIGVLFLLFSLSCVIPGWRNSNQIEIPGILLIKLPVVISILLCVVILFLGRGRISFWKNVGLDFSNNNRFGSDEFILEEVPDEKNGE